MNKYEKLCPPPAERLIAAIFAGRQREADSPMARLHLENRLHQAAAERRAQRPRLLVRSGIKVAAFICALLLLGGWASGLELSTWDDGQRITMQLPSDFTPAAYPHWVAIFANHAAKLIGNGGHSLVVDYKLDHEGRYNLELGLLGVNYSQANDWLRGVMDDIPELQDTPYAITQPRVPYRISVADMLGYRLFGNSEIVERNVVRAWLFAGDSPRHVYLITQSSDYARRVSMLDL